jgi:murein DD-endopeptidase MepM/ murein hydrolase activator NlpD
MSASSAMQGKAPAPAGQDGGALLRWASETYLVPMSSLVLVNSAWVGLGMWLVLLQQPAFVAVGLGALSLAAAIDAIVRPRFGARVSPVQRLNMLLGGLVAAWLVLPLGYGLPQTMATLVAIQLMVLFGTVFAEQLLRGSDLPPMILAYCLTATMLFTLAPLSVHIAATHFQWPAHGYTPMAEFGAVFVEAMGAFVFLPSVQSGLVICALLAVYSPTMFLAGVLGWIAGALTALALQQFGIVFSWQLPSFNFFLAGMAVGSAFFVPSRGSLAAAVCAGAVAALVAAFLQNLLLVPGLSFLPIPFLTSLYVMLLSLRSMPLTRSTDWFTRPEIRRLDADWLAARWGDHRTPLLAIPVAGPVEVTQAFDGRITHRDRWRHALDFERPAGATGEAGSIWGAAVYPPLPGEVVQLRADIPDNPPGRANFGENWGNHIVIRAESGVCVQLSHLMRGSVAVELGQRVSFATPLAQAGNSGRSLSPHLHLQAQSSPVVGAETVPFRLANFLDCDRQSLAARRWRAAGIPEQGEILSQAAINPAVHDLLTSIRPGRTIWSFVSEGQLPPALRPRSPVVITTSITPSGSYLLESPQGDRLEARLDPDAWRVENVAAAPGSLLAALAAAASTIPYCAFEGLEWSDALPAQFPPLQRALVTALAPGPGARLNRIHLRCTQVPGGSGATLVTTGVTENAGRHAPESCTAEFRSDRGAMRVAWRKNGCGVTYTVASFVEHLT